jgi:hypothetical protein
MTAHHDGLLDCVGRRDPLGVVVHIELLDGADLLQPLGLGSLIGRCIRRVALRRLRQRDGDARDELADGEIIVPGCDEDVEERGIDGPRCGAGDIESGEDVAKITAAVGEGEVLEAFAVEAAKSADCKGMNGGSSDR